MSGIKDQRKPVPRRHLWRLVVAVESSLAGALVAFTVASMLDSEGPRNAAIIHPQGAAVLGGIGGAVTGLILSGAYGLAGRTGWLVAVSSSLLAPSLAGAIAGTCLFPGPGTLIGGYMPLWTFYYPQSIAVWATCLVLIHLHALRMRAANQKTQRPVQLENGSDGKQRPPRSEHCL